MGRTLVVAVICSLSSGCAAVKFVGLGVAGLGGALVIGGITNVHSCSGVQACVEDNTIPFAAVGIGIGAAVVGGTVSLIAYGIERDLQDQNEPKVSEITADE
jgi:hypothetical protein